MTNTDKLMMAVRDLQRFARDAGFAPRPECDFLDYQPPPPGFTYPMYMQPATLADLRKGATIYYREHPYKVTVVELLTAHGFPDAFLGDDQKEHDLTGALVDASNLPPGSWPAVGTYK
jgi:hypothetical protein